MELIVDTPIRRHANIPIRDFVVVGALPRYEICGSFRLRDLRSNRLRCLNRGQRDCVDDVIDRSSPR
jgi:hypothetical protein